jgi:hypothetical protein
LKCGPCSRNVQSASASVNIPLSSPPKITESNYPHPSL